MRNLKEIMQRGFADYSIAITYRRLRYLISGTLIGLPLLTAASGYWVGNYSLQASLSDYYFVAADGDVPRTLFLIFLAFVSSALFAYKGLDRADDLIHNIAGFFALGVALFPMECNTSEHCHCFPGLMPYLHLPSAGLLYISALASVIYSGGPNLRKALNKLADKQKWLTKLNHIRIFSAVLMTIGIVSFFIHQQYPAWLPGFSWIFWIEYVGFFGFGLYWLRLMLFINAANHVGRQKTQVAKQEYLKHLALPSDITERDRQAPYVEEWIDIP